MREEKRVTAEQMKEDAARVDRRVIKLADSALAARRRTEKDRQALNAVLT